MIEAYKRWRHRRGFGIHSPFAYKVVKDVIDQPCAFYGYQDIEEALEHTRRPAELRKFARLLLRLSAFLRPEKICMSRSAPDLLSLALRLGYSRAEVTGMHTPSSVAKGCTLFIDTDRTFGADEIEKLAGLPHITLFLINAADEVHKRIKEEPPAGVTFYSKRHILIFTRPDFPPVIYSMRLP